MLINEEKTPKITHDGLQQEEEKRANLKINMKIRNFGSYER